MDMKSNCNQNKIDILINSLKASFGLFIFAFGVYLTIQANIGVSPWDTFNIGLSQKLHVLYGTVSITISLIIVGIDVLMKEKIGIGMLLDAILVGKFIDLFNYIHLIPYANSMITGLIMMIVGMIIQGFAQIIYVKVSLGSGPRDTLVVGLKKKSSIPLGIICIILLGSVTFFGWLLGGPIGIGTLVCTLLEGPIMQFDFDLMKFDPTKLTHQDIMTSVKIIFRK